MIAKVHSGGGAMKWLAWALRRRMIYSGTRFVVISTFFGPIIPGLLLSVTTAFPPYGPKSFLDQIVTSLGFAIGALVVGAVPALIASVLIVLRRPVSFIEALAITVVTTFTLYFIFICAASWLSGVDFAAGAGLTMAVLSVPGAIGAALLAARWGAFSPSRLPGAAATASTKT